MQFDAAWSGRLVPHGDFEGTVHSVFRRVCNIELGDGRLLALLSPDIPRTPWGIRLAQISCPFQEIFSPGMHVAQHANSIFFPESDVHVCLEGTRIWTGDRLLPLSLEQVSAVAGLLEAFLVQHERAKLKKQSAAISLFSPAIVSAPDLFFVMQRSCMDAVESLVTATCALDAENAIAAGARLLGVGPGLTPAGDDFIVGFLAGLTCMNGDSPRHGLFLREFGRGLRTLAYSSTSRVAFLFIDCAVSGLFTESVADVARCAAADLNSEPTGTIFLAAVQHLLSFGATSGADTLYGFLHSLKGAIR